MQKQTYREVGNLKIYNKAFDLATKIFNEVKDLKEYSLRDQIIRCSTSVFANICEGYSFVDQYKAKYLNFLFNAYGSHNETKSWINFLAAVNLLDTDVKNELMKEVDEINYMFVALINKVKDEIESENAVLKNKTLRVKTEFVKDISNIIQDEDEDDFFRDVL